MYVSDKGDVWGYIWPRSDMETIHYDDGTTAPLATDLVQVPFGKYKGWKLSEVMDAGYLEWMLKDAVDKGDVFMEKCARLRLLELR